MTTPDFNDLTPPDDLVREWFRCDSSRVTSENHWRHIATEAARWGARHGWEQARQLWPEPIADRPPIEADGDDKGAVQVVTDSGCWSAWYWESAAKEKRPWLHTPRWQPRRPTLQEWALEELARLEKNFHVDPVIRRALEQAGEGVENE